MKVLKGMLKMFVVVRFVNMMVMVLVFFFGVMRFVVMMELMLKNVLWYRVVIIWLIMVVV